MSANKIIFIILILFFGTLCFAQESGGQDKYTAVNFMVERIYFTRYGLIIHYFKEGRYEYLYLPNKFFEERIAVRIKEGDGKIVPQMSVIFKNLEPIKVKIYVPFVFDGPKYRIVDYVPTKMEERFKNTEKIEITIFKDETKTE
jgi:hypothetical protein